MNFQNHRICISLLRRKGRKIAGIAVIIMVTVCWFLSTFINTPDRKILNKKLSYSISHFFHMKRDRFINLHQYEYIHSSKICENKSLTILIAVHSCPKYLVKRKTIRETYGSRNRIANESISTVFILANVLDNELQRQIDLESERYGDIVQGNFIDSYVNMTHKHVMTMHWVTNYCQNVRVIVKVDDDVFVNPFNLVSYITSNNIGTSFHCMVLDKEVPYRKPSEKYFIPPEMYPFDIFPEYCIGFGYITTPEVYREVYSVSRDARYLNMDDVFVTGILAMKSHINLVDITNRMFLCRWFHFKSIIAPMLRNLIFMLNEKNECVMNAYDMWRFVTQVNTKKS